MSMENSPSLNDNGEISPNPIKQISAKQQRLRRIIAILLAVMFVVGSLNLIQQLNPPAIPDTGIVRGAAINEQGNPFKGYIYVEGTTLEASTNPDGSFEVINVPSGIRMIVVADDVIGREFIATVTAGQVTEMGTLQFQTTAEP